MGTRILATSALAVFLFALGGCADPEPYVYRSGEFDRGSSDFGRDPTDVKAVAICYNRRVTSPAQLQEMARAECAKFGKVARYTQGRILTCPLALPLGAHFECVGP
ncbi:MAG: hypothetical protein QGF38_08845 [Rhodospirillales bacterium]|jgi:hypothetical protein|nr:hypothetical protein [Rhodospirillales bacterium]